MKQKNRQYELIIGDWQNKEGLRITDLQVTFDISKASNNKEQTNSAAIEVYNLSEESLRMLETDFPVAVFSAGYEGNVKRLFAGEVVELSTRMNGPDRVTQILMGSGYVALTQVILNKVIPPGKTIKDVIEEVRKELPGVSRGVYAGTNINNTVVYGYGATGTAKEILNELARAHSIEWRVDNNVLYVNDTKGTIDKDYSTAPVISSSTGLIEIPYYTSGKTKRAKKEEGEEHGVQFKTLLNPEIRPGSIVRLESSTITGWYKVTSARFYGDYRGNDWYVECYCKIPQEST